MQQKKRPTIIDVALAAKVGASTVSRHVRGGESVSRRVAQRIDAAIAQLGYEPNTLARGLRVGRSRTLGVLFPHVNNIFFGNAMRTIQVEAQRRGFTVMLLMHQEDPKLQQEQLISLKRSQVDGIILVPAAESNVAQVRQLLGKTPVVTFDRPLGRSLDSVTLHNRDAGRQATEHLLWHKHSHIVSINAPHKVHPLEGRLKGHQEAMDAAGKKVETIVWQNAKQLEADLWQALRRKRAPATAILSMSYSITIAILSMLRDRNIALREVGFIGVDDLEFASFLDPPLTTFAQPADKFAQLAFEQLMQRIDGSDEAVARIILPGLLVIRASCGCEPKQTQDDKD
jgi:LacI family transcriptional regulator